VVTIAAVVQARMSSVRLPGKVLRPLAGRAALDWLLEGLEHAESLDGTIVATSTDPSDEEIAAYCERRGVACRRGPLDDVAARLAEVVEGSSLDVFVRVSADSPVLDYRLVDEGVRRFAAGDADLVTNVYPRTYPHGQSVEVVSAAAFARARSSMSDEEREHVTLAFYRRPREFRIASFGWAPAGAADQRLVLDTEEDAARLERLLLSLTRPHWTYRWDELLELTERAA
jgi:spore coat polysaccharide biosynthesis protein SpsF